MLRGIHVGSFGTTITITLVSSGVAQNLATYTGTHVARARSPRGHKYVSATVTTATATDGTVTFSWANGDIDRGGLWMLQVEMGGAADADLLGSDPIPMPVGPRIRNN